MGNTFHHLDDLVLQLKGLVLLRKLREQRGADSEQLTMYGTEIERVSAGVAAGELIRRRSVSQSSKYRGVDRFALGDLGMVAAG